MAVVFGGHAKAGPIDRWAKTIAIPDRTAALVWELDTKRCDNPRMGGPKMSCNRLF